jgi:hypothetical protein
MEATQYRPRVVAWEAGRFVVINVEPDRPSVSDVVELVEQRALEELWQLPERINSLESFRTQPRDTCF